MSNTGISTASYLAVIADLRAKRDELDRTIAMLEAMAGIQSAKASEDVLPSKDAQPKHPVASAPPLQATGLGDACMEVLRLVNRPMTNREIVEELEARGFDIKGQDKANNVGASVYHRAKTKGDVERVDRTSWRLCEPRKVPIIDGSDLQAKHEGAAH